MIAKSQPGRKTDFKNYQQTLLSLEEIYLNTKVKALTGVSHWTALEKVATCHILANLRNVTDIDDLYYAVMSSLYLPSVFLVVDRCAYIPTAAEKEFVAKVLKTAQKPRDIYRSLLLSRLWGAEPTVDEIASMINIYSRMEENFHENMVRLSKNFAHVIDC